MASAELSSSPSPASSARWPMSRSTHEISGLELQLVYAPAASVPLVHVCSQLGRSSAALCYCKFASAQHAKKRACALLLATRTCDQVNLRQQAHHAGLPPPRRAARRAGGCAGPISSDLRQQLRGDEHDRDRAGLLPSSGGRLAAVQEHHLHVVVNHSTPCAYVPAFSLYSMQRQEQRGWA